MMRKSLLSTAILAASLSAATQAADVQINGFASIVGGKAMSQGTQHDPYSPAEFDATYTDFSTSSAPYDDEISFKPDSIYGLQIRSDLGNGLAVTGQITGAGGEDFDAEISWAYASYQLNPEMMVQAGRQRLPLFFYSDFIDVAYSYHWIRLPNVLAGAQVDTFEGVKFNWTPYTDNWEYRVEVYGGAGDQYVAQVNDKIYADSMYGATVKMSNDWLQLRAMAVNFDLSFGDTAAAAITDENYMAVDKDNAKNTTIWGVAAYANIGNGFVTAEYTESDIENIGFAADALGNEGEYGWYISAGYRLGDFTPHITYGEHASEIISQSYPNGGPELAWSNVIVGVRWDFHPKAAFKLEYTMQSDDSDYEYQNLVGTLSPAGTYPVTPGNGHGERYEADVINFGVDIVF